MSDLYHFVRIYDGLGDLWLFFYAGEIALLRIDPISAGFTLYEYDIFLPDFIFRADNNLFQIWRGLQSIIFP